jgi:hypothetical protein
MQDEHNQLRRREFLKIGGVGVAAVAAAPLLAQVPQEKLTSRSVPARPVILRTAKLELTLDSAHGLPYQYRLLSSRAVILGEDLGRPITARVCRKAEWTFANLPVTARGVKTTAGNAVFAFDVVHESRPAATFAIRYELSGATVIVTMSDVQERDGYELIEVAMPRLATVLESDAGAWLAHGDEGGNVALLADAKPTSLPPNRFWGKVLGTLPFVMVGSDRALCLQETTAYMDGTELTVSGEPGSRRASLGTVKTHRVDGSGCYDLNSDPDKPPKNCGTAKTPNLLIEQASSCRLDFVEAPAGGKADWLLGARLARARMPAIPTRYYDDKFTYGIRCDEPRFPQPTATFDDCEKLIRDVAALTDNAPQVAHLWGWQYKGKDSGYPAVREVNQRIGGFDRMMRLMDEMRPLNCNVTFSDNFDDAYRSSPEWDEGIIARRPDGELWLSRNWTGENSYIIGLAKYMQGPGPERIKYTCERYKLRESTHVDVLSYYAMRNDWDPQRPAGAIKNFEARCRILDEFRKRGVDVSSEALRYPFIGRISCFWYMTGPRACPFGGKPIPLLATIYRKSAAWGLSGGQRNAPLIDRLMNQLFYNGRAHMILRADLDRSEITDNFYLIMVPWYLTHARNIETFRREGERTQIGFEGGADLDVDWAQKSYTLKLAGNEVARDTSVFCPFGDGRLALYSVSAAELAPALPAGWNADKVAAIALSTGKAEEVPVKVEGRKLRVAVAARRPVIVYRDGDAARRRLLGSALA